MNSPSIFILCIISSVCCGRLPVIPGWQRNVLSTVRNVQGYLQRGRRGAALCRAFGFDSFEGRRVASMLFKGFDACSYVDVSFGDFDMRILQVDNPDEFFDIFEGDISIGHALRAEIMVENSSLVANIRALVESKARNNRSARLVVLVPRSVKDGDDRAAEQRLREIVGDIWISTKCDVGTEPPIVEVLGYEPGIDPVKIASLRRVLFLTAVRMLTSQPHPQTKRIGTIYRVAAASNLLKRRLLYAAAPVYPVIRTAREHWTRNLLENRLMDVDSVPDIFRVIMDSDIIGSNSSIIGPMKEAISSTKCEVPSNIRLNSGLKQVLTREFHKSVDVIEDRVIENLENELRNLEEELSYKECLNIEDILWRLERNATTTFARAAEEMKRDFVQQLVPPLGLSSSVIRSITVRYPWINPFLRGMFVYSLHAVRLRAKVAELMEETKDRLVAKNLYREKSRWPSGWVSLIITIPRTSFFLARQHTPSSCPPSPTDTPKRELE